MFGDSNDTEVAAHSWAAVVKGNSGLDEDARAKRDAIAKQIKDGNAVKAREKQEAEEKRLAELEEIGKQKDTAKELRERALEVARESGQQASSEMDVFGDSFEGDFVTEPMEGVTVDKGKFGGNGSMVDSLVPQLPKLVPRVVSGDQRTVGSDADDPGGGERGSKAGVEGVQPGVLRRLVIDRIDPALLGPVNPDSLLLGGGGLKLDSTLETIFGDGATRLAIEFEGMSNVETVHNISDSSNEDVCTEISDSTSVSEGQSKKRLRGREEGSLIDLTRIGFDGEISSGDDSEEGIEGDSKKLKVGGSDKESSDEEKVIDTIGEQESQQAEVIDQMQVAPESLSGLNQEPQVPDGSC